jgi:hypothetical protein
MVQDYKDKKIESKKEENDTSISSTNTIKNIENQAINQNEENDLNKTVNDFMHIENIEQINEIEEHHLTIIDEKKEDTFIETSKTKNETFISEKDIKIYINNDQNCDKETKDKIDFIYESVKRSEEKTQTISNNFTKICDSFVNLTEIVGNIGKEVFDIEDTVLRMWKAILRVEDTQGKIIEHIIKNRDYINKHTDCLREYMNTNNDFTKNLLELGEKR